MSIEAVIGQEVVLTFLVFDLDGTTPKTGLTDGDFTKELFVDGAASAVVPTVSEIGTTGTYAYRFTPDATGIWFAQARWDSLGDWYGEWLRVLGLGIPEDLAESQMNVSYDNIDRILYMEVWLDRHGRSIPGANLISCEVRGYNVNGLLLFTENSSTPKADGRFSLSTPLELDSDRPYNITVVITDNLGSVTTYQSFTAAGR